MLIIRGGINSKKRELCPTALALSAFYYNKNKHADTYIMYLHAYSTREYLTIIGFGIRRSSNSGHIKIANKNAPVALLVSSKTTGAPKKGYTVHNFMIFYLNKVFPCQYMIGRHFCNISVPPYPPEAIR